MDNIDKASRSRESIRGMLLIPNNFVTGLELGQPSSTPCTSLIRE